MPRWIATFAFVGAVLAGTCGCGVRKTGYEFLAMPRAGLVPGSRWKAGIGAVKTRLSSGVEVSGRQRGLDWLRRKTSRKGGGRLRAALAGFFAVGLGVESHQITSVEARGLRHRQVADPDKLPRGYSYLWETIEAEKVSVTVAAGASGSIEAKIGALASSRAGRKLGLKFSPVAGSGGKKFEVSGRGLVVAVKVVAFDVSSESKAVTVKVGRAHQDRDQAGPFGYRIAVKGGDVELLTRRFRAVFRNRNFADSETGNWERTISGRSTKIHAGPVIGGKFDVAVDRAYVSGWNFDGLCCEVSFERRTWTLRQTGCGLETVK